MYVVMFCVRVAQSLSLEQSAQKSDKIVILVPTSKLAENDFFYKYYSYPHILGILFLENFMNFIKIFWPCFLGFQAL